MFCPTCGIEVATAAAQFCVNCGTSLPRQVSSASVPVPQVLATEGAPSVPVRQRSPFTWVAVSLLPIVAILLVAFQLAGSGR